MERFTTDAVILRIVDHGEGHRIVELLSPDRGLLRAFAPGAQRSRRRFGGALEPTHAVRATLRLRPGRDLATLDEATVTGAHPGIRADLGAFARASVMVELVRALVKDGEAQPALHALLVAGLDALDAGGFRPGGWWPSSSRRFRPSARRRASTPARGAAAPPAAGPRASRLPAAGSSAPSAPPGGRPGT